MDLKAYYRFHASSYLGLYTKSVPLKLESNLQKREFI